ncbi:MAG: enoyl-CoA hydratase/isomerase family protein [Candidatus Acidiferrales bacterium]
MPAEYSSIVCDIHDSMAKITLNQPPLNIIDIPMMKEIQRALEHIKAADDVKVLVFDHQGKAFSAGVSIKDHSPEKVGEMLETFHGIFRLLNAIEMPSVALIDGMALGGGCELAVFCDMVIASDRATFGQPEIKVGVFPPVAAAYFPRLVGRNRTLELLLTGDVIDAAEAKAIGLINRVIPAEVFKEKSDEFIRKFTSLSGRVLALTKRAVDQSLYTSIIEGVSGTEQLYLRELMKTEDAQEGLNAFLGKRNPTWKNR